MTRSLDLRDVFASPGSRRAGRRGDPLEALSSLAMEVSVELAAFLPEVAPPSPEPEPVRTPRGPSGPPPHA